MKTNQLVIGLTLGACLLAASCGSDSDTATGAAGSAGSGTSGNAGSAGSGTSGSSGSGGEAGSVEPAAPANPHSVVVPQDAPTPGTLLAEVSDFTTASELVAVKLSDSSVLGSLQVTDGDAVVKSSGGLGFLLERTNNKVDLIDAGAISKTFDLTSAPSGAAPSHKAYVGFYSRTLLAVLDLDTGAVASTIDLSEFDDASDTDGSADIDSGVYDPASKIAYFTLARIDLNTLVPPAVQLACPSIKGLVIGIDTTNDSVVDLNGAAPGKGIELSLVAPTSLSFDAAGKQLVISASGCYTASALGKSGVEVVDLMTNTAHVAYASPNDDFISEAIATGSGQALLFTSDSSYASHVYQLDLGDGSANSGSLGVELTNVPSNVSWDGALLFGLDATPMKNIVSYDPTNGPTTATTLVSAPWTLNSSSAYGSALAN